MVLHQSQLNLTEVEFPTCSPFCKYAGCPSKDKPAHLTLRVLWVLVSDCEYLFVNRGTAMLSTPVETTFVQIGVKVFDYYFVSDVLGNLQFSHHRL